MNTEIDCIIPAAGLSSRMKSWKPLLPYNNSTLIETAVDRALETCSRIVLVTGYRGEELEKLFEGREEIDLVRNEHYRRGMFSSIKTGASHIAAPLFFIALADMPKLTSGLYRYLIETIERGVELNVNTKEPYLPAGKSPEMLRPLCAGKPGHPVLCRKNVASTILSEADDSTMQNVMSHHRVLEIEVEHSECLYDVDNPEDLKIEKG